MSNNIGPEDLVPELGDLVTFVSRVHKNTTGHIVYRDGSLIRIRPYGFLGTVDFDLDPATGQFAERLGVTEIIMHKKRKDPHYSVQLSTAPGELLEFYTPEGYAIDAGLPHIVQEVIATDSEDAIVLTDGTRLDFGFIGPHDIALIVASVPPEEGEAGENNAALVGAPVEDETEPFPEFDASLLPAALVEEIPTEERTYSDTIQRADMFSSLFSDETPARQRDPKVMANLYRIADLLLAIKNSVITRDEAGAIKVGELRSYIANTVEEALAKQPTGAPIAALIPVAAVKKVLYSDDAVKLAGDDYETRSDIRTLMDALKSLQDYSDSDATGNPFVKYVNGLLKTIEAFTAAKEGSARISVDQDVLRSQIPPKAVDGFPYNGPPPAKDKDGDAIPLIAADILGKIENRSARLLGPSRIRNPITGANFTVASADTAETVGHVVLSKTLANLRAPTRSGVLLWDMQASAAASAQRTSFYKALMTAWEDQIVIETGAGDATPLATQLAGRIEPSLSFINHENQKILDSLGLRNLELTDEMLDLLKEQVITGTAAWDVALKSLKTASIEALQKPRVPAIPATQDMATSPLFAADVLGDAELQPVIQEIKDRETLLDDYDLVYANNLVEYAESTLGPLWYALMTKKEDLITHTRATYTTELLREQRNTSVRRGLAAEFHAEPVVNPCKHVHELEKIMGVREDGKRMLLLQKFIVKYKGGQHDNYLTCGSCDQHLLCKHEVLLLNEFLNPGRSQVLHKALLLEYGNGVFEGAYICKNCGQKIADLEYDTHLEFDDDGRPISGRAVLEPETAEDDLALGVVIEAEADEASPFKTPKEKAMYNIARILFERLGATPSEEIYARIIPSAIFYMEKLAKKEAYEADRAKKIAAKAPVIPVEYDVFYASSIIGVLGALAVLELQTTDLAVPIPLSGVPFARTGFPIEDSGETTVLYVVYGIAGLALGDDPWNKTSWAASQRATDRQKAVRNVLLTALYRILQKPISAAAPAVPPLGTISDLYKKALEAARAKVAAAQSTVGEEGKTSALDRFPPSFRPLQSAAVAVAEPVTEAAVGNRDRFLTNAAEGDVAEVGPVVAARAHTLAQQIVADFHAAAAASAILIPGNPRSDSNCCAIPLQNVKKTGLGLASLEVSEAKKAELDLIDSAVRRVQQRDPAAPAAGTHIYVPWSAPYTVSVLPTLSPDDYYKLFVKNCFLGRNYGLPHEFGPTYVCRHCRFAIPQEMLYPAGSDASVNMRAKDREAYIARVLEEQKEAAIAAISEHVMISEETFRRLEDKIRQRRGITTKEPPRTPPFLTRLAELGDSALNMALPSTHDEMAVLLASLQRIATEGIAEDIERRAAIADFSGRYDALLASVEARMTDLMPRNRKEYVKPALEDLAKITANAEGAIGARNIVQIFVVYGEQIADDYVNDNPHVTKWLPQVSRSHKEDVTAIWKRLAFVASKRLDELRRFDADVINVVNTALRRFTGWLGTWLGIWINEFRPGTEATQTELTLLLRWLTLSAIQALLSTESPLYADAEVPDNKVTAVKFMNDWITDALTTAGQRVDTYQLSEAQVSEKLNIRAEKELALFIDKFERLPSDLRKIELLKKSLRLGDWSAGKMANMRKYNSDFYELKRGQLAEMGIPLFSSEVTGLPDALGAQQQQEGGNMNDNLHYADDGEGQYDA